jgi:hypothetical protein
MMRALLLKIWVTNTNQMKSINILIMLLGHMALIYLHRYHMSISGIYPLQFIGFMASHAIWHFIIAKRLYIRI